jgi:two-component system, chemotaxis family, chemotaxis protein CheY
LGSRFLSVIERKGKALKASQLSVLVVDDQPFYCNLLSEIMRAIGIYKFKIATNGQEAWELLDSFIPDIIITDWMMPELNGLELTKKIRKLRDEKLCQIPIIMITSNNLKAQIEEARGAGVDTFVLKPLSVKAVWDRVKEVIETPRAFVVTNEYIGPCRRSKRENKGFFGPFRRFDDPMELPVALEEELKAKDKIRPITAKLHKMVSALKNGDNSIITHLSKATQEVMGIAREVEDTQLSKVCWSLNTYLEKFAPINRLRVDIISAHLQSMEVLIGTPFADNGKRDELIRELHSVVMRSLRAA